MEKTKNRSRLTKVMGMFAVMMVLLLSATLTLHADGPKPKKISTPTKSITVTEGKDFELSVKMSPRSAEDDYLKWSIISGKSYVAFEDDDRYDDEIELKALKPGKAKVRCQIRGTKTKLTFTITVKEAAKKKIEAVGSRAKTVDAGEEFELEVKKYSGLSDKYLKWKIQDTSIVKFDDDDRTGDDMEFKARKAGKTTITCTNTKTKQVIKYTITVKEAPKKIKAVGSVTKNVRVGEEFELEVKKYSGLKDRYLKWTIKDTSLVRFEDRDERTGDEVEFVAKKAGTVKIVCTDTKKNQKITYKIVIK